MQAITQTIIDAAREVEDQLNQKDQKIVLLQAASDILLHTTVFDALETTSWLVAPGTAANTGSTGSTAIASQAQPGSNSAWLGIAPNGPWADAYFYKKNGADAAKNTFTLDLFAFFADLAASGASNCVELDIQQVIAGQGFNTGFQFDFGGNRLRVWDRDRKEKGLPEPWVATGQPCPRWKPGQWNHIIFETHRDGANVYHDALTFNGTRIPLGQNFPSPALALPDMLNCAIQLDGNKPGTPYRLYIDRVKFTVSQR